MCYIQENAGRFYTKLFIVQVDESSVRFGFEVHDFLSRNNSLKVEGSKSPWDLWHQVDGRQQLARKQVLSRIQVCGSFSDGARKSSKGENQKWSPHFSRDWEYHYRNWRVWVDHRKFPMKIGGLLNNFLSLTASILLSAGSKAARSQRGGARGSGRTERVTAVSKLVGTRLKMTELHLITNNQWTNNRNSDQTLFLYSYQYLSNNNNDRRNFVFISLAKIFNPYPDNNSRFS